MHKIDFSKLKQEEKPPNICVVRISTECYQKGNGYYYSKRVAILKKKSKGYNILEEDVANLGVEGVLPRILNLQEVEDGTYELVMSNISYDYEYGCIDDYDFELKDVCIRE